MMAAFNALYLLSMILRDINYYTDSIRCSILLKINTKLSLFVGTTNALTGATARAREEHWIESYIPI